MYFQTLIACIPIFLVFFSSLNYCYPEISRKNYKTKRMAGESIQEKVPYAVNILKKNKTQLCTGIIIHQYYILTAAQCIEKDGIFVSVGDKRLKPVKTICHEAYVPGIITKYDLALIKLNDDDLKVDGKTISILPLSNKPWPSDTKILEEGLDCFTAGYGATSLNTTSKNVARTLSVKAIHGDHACRCLRSFQNRRVVCLVEGLKVVRALCKGDMGAPLVHNGSGIGVGHARYNPDNCQQTNIGDQGSGCDQTQSVYMYICPHLDWIGKTVPGIPKQPISCRATKPVFKVFLALIFGMHLF